MKPTTTEVARPPGRPRSRRADAAIIDAVLDLLAEGTTVEALSMEAVAGRAGVGKATIYRRWPNKEELVTDAVAALKGPLPVLRGESVRADLIQMLRFMTKQRGSREAMVLPCLIPELERNARLHELYDGLIEKRRELTRSILRRGMATGELRPDFDVDVAISVLAAPMIVQSLFNWNRQLDTEAMPEQIVDLVLTGLCPR